LVLEVLTVHEDQLVREGLEALQVQEVLVDLVDPYLPMVLVVPLIH
jgi:hypothetical protein